MSVQPNFGSTSPNLIVAAATISTVVALGTLSGVVTIFQSRGAPMEQLGAAERVCAHYAYLSERQTCMNEWLAASQATTVASR